jgi:hypothetical protein
MGWGDGVTHFKIFVLKNGLKWTKMDNELLEELCLKTL